MDSIEKLCDEVETVNRFCCDVKRQLQQELESVEYDPGNVESYCLEIGFFWRWKVKFMVVA